MLAFISTFGRGIRFVYVYAVLLSTFQYQIQTGNAVFAFWEATYYAWTQQAQTAIFHIRPI